MCVCTCTCTRTHDLSGESPKDYQTSGFLHELNVFGYGVCLGWDRKGGGSSFLWGVCMDVT